MKRYLEAQKRYLETVSKTIQGLKQEKEETQVMMKTFFSVLTQKLPQGHKPEPEEIEAALEQLKDVHKMAGLFVLAITPGSVVTLPALCALGKRFGIEVLPSAFKKLTEEELNSMKELEVTLSEESKARLQQQAIENVEHSKNEQEVIQNK
ncbi:MAG: hypothetical protein ACJA1U_002288 [Bermanella sp.]|jgi:hypothetical protein